MTKQELQYMIEEAVESKLEAIEEADRIFEEEGEDIIKEAYMDLYIAENTDEEEVLEEGANIENYKTFTAAKKECKANIKKIKSLLKAGDKEGAKKACKEAKESLKKAETIVKNTKGDVGSAILGFFAQGLLESSQTLLLSLGIAGANTTGKTIAKNANTRINNRQMFDFDDPAGDIEDLNRIGNGVMIFNIAQLAQCIKNLVAYIKDLKQWLKMIKDPNETSTDNLNMVRVKLLRYFNDLEKMLDKIEKSIK